VVGREAMYRFCQEHGLPNDRCGKLVVATHATELPILQELELRGQTNGLRGLRQLGPEQIREREPHITGLAGLLVPETGIADYAAVTRALATLIQKAGQAVRT
jgi:(S)-2-hydroxyglutarate dehydrogenase